MFGLFAVRKRQYTIDPKIAAFLSLIAWSEFTSANPATNDDGYDIIVSGENGANTFTDYSDHPFANGRPPIVVDAHLSSTASGRYQQMLHDWRYYKIHLDLPDFGHDSQDRMAIQHISECNAIHLIEAGDIAGAIKACSRIWASFPGNDYGQGGHSLSDLVAEYHKLLV